MELRLDFRRWGRPGASWDRLRAALLHERADRIPITAWRHFPGFDDSEALARVHLAFQMRYAFDVMVFTPTYAYTAEPWGFQRGSAVDEHGLPEDPERPFVDVETWPHMRAQAAGCPPFHEVLRGLRLVRRNLQEDVPILVTVYGPLTTARFLRGDRIRKDIEGLIAGTDDAGLGSAVTVLSNVIRAFLEAALEIADGVYYISYFTCTECTDNAATAAEAMDYDLAPLIGLSDRDKLLGLHMHGHDLLFDDVIEYPIDLFNWHDRWAKPSLRDARMKTDALLMGGINEADTMHRETAAAVSLQIGDAVSQVDGKGLVIAPGGPIHLQTPSENLRAAVKALEDLG